VIQEPSNSASKSREGGGSGALLCKGIALYGDNFNEAVSSEIYYLQTNFRNFLNKLHIRLQGNH
jgi:hypothetical protein